MDTVIGMIAGFLLGITVVAFGLHDLYSQCEELNNTNSCSMVFVPAEGGN